MPPTLALGVWLLLAAGLLCFDPAKAPKTSAALWVPVTWLLILATRLPSVWLGGQAESVGTALEEGNPLDRTILFGLMSLAIWTLASRSFNWGGFLRRNLALAAFLGFALISFAWSDFPLIAVKRWFRDLGDYLVVLVVLSDIDPLEAVRTLLRRVSYVVISLSILLIKYFPERAIAYDAWTGGATYAGATTSKNMLGIACLISGLYFFWDTVVRWPERKRRRTKRILLVNCFFFALTVWLLSMCDSATSRLCLALGCAVIAAAHMKMFQRSPGFLKLMPPSFILGYAALAYGFGMSGQLATAVGRDPTFTGRAQIWAAVLSVHTNPLLGTGYESFWLGPRLEKVWQAAGEGVLNEAHNGYLEGYLNLGLIGMFLLSGFVCSGFAKISKRLKPFQPLASLQLAVWTVFLFHNFTEADFRSGPLWLMFTLASLSIRVKEPRKQSGPPERQEVSPTGGGDHSTVASSDVGGVTVPGFSSGWGYV